ncbi:S-adenosyl-L-methionine-dependent methyltransferase [Tricharina praecox]|uniref:S-adenosyl-L-methionine-dependent methyltransferase n=1 Tax=Tricharina praecox TaxID=43433 RepID=UPI0022209F1E|nr:S-adenosyl-L-methionine-dependent methyltransferase [Tricharina praecox]KAI5856821.1 S-adenosyl-L-methionine-dependent methyltransferase [Tricharina praecox]
MASQGLIEMEMEVNDWSSDGYVTSTQSLRASINETIFENGRRYHTYYGYDKNMLPVDEAEQDRLDLHHEVFLSMMDGKLHAAPIDSGKQRILDIGTGTGIWAVDMADTYPNAKVIGTDLSPIQPKWVPPNCRFEVDDAELEWTYRAESFDFIHVRNLAASISDWPRMMSEIYRATKPGGYVEIGELGGRLFSDDGTMTEENPLKKSFDLTIDTLETLGRTFPVAGTLQGRLEAAGFADVKEFSYKQPYGPWPKDKRMKQIGAMALVMLDTGIEAYGIAPYTRILKMDPGEASKIIHEAKEVAKDLSIHTHSMYYVAYGRKPAE